MTVEFVPVRRLSVRVLQRDNEEPAPGIKVGIGDGVSGTFASGVTDAKGSVVVKLPAGVYPVNLDPPRFFYDSIRTYTSVRVEDRPEDQAAVFRIDPGCILLVEAVDAETGKGVPGVTIMEERDSDGQPGRGELQVSTAYVERAKTDNEGRLRAVIPPGRKTISLGLLPGGLNYDSNPQTRTVDLPAGETVRVRFELRRRDK